MSSFFYYSQAVRKFLCVKGKVAIENIYHDLFIIDRTYHIQITNISPYLAFVLQMCYKLNKKDVILCAND